MAGVSVLQVATLRGKLGQLVQGETAGAELELCIVAAKFVPLTSPAFFPHASYTLHTHQTSVLPLHNSAFPPLFHCFAISPYSPRGPTLT